MRKVPAFLKISGWRVSLSFWMRFQFLDKTGGFRSSSQTIHSASGTIWTFRAHETTDGLYVAGLAKPHQLIRPARVDIQLIAADGRIIAEKTEDLDTPGHPRTAGGRRGNYSYVARFPLSKAREAAKIRVVYHGGARSQSS